MDDGDFLKKSLDMEAVAAAFSLPGGDGSFDLDFRQYLHELGTTRPSVVLAFAPKAAGTYLRTASIVAIKGVLVRTVHAQGGRDASFYMPTFLSYYADHRPARTLVTHVHMQALPANRHFINAFDLRPVVMMRSIPDMLASYLDMLEKDALSADNWLNLAVPADYPRADAGAKADFVVEMMGPWYASYFATWIDYANQAPGRVCMVTYDGFLDNPAGTLEEILAHSRVPQSRGHCETALQEVWDTRTQFRFNKGVAGRGQSRFSAEQLARLERQVCFYPDLRPLKDMLVPPAR